MEKFIYLGSIDLFICMISFVLYLFICGIVINGIFIVTRGETVLAPDGSEKDINDMIFYPLLKWIIQKKGEYYIKFEGDQLMKLCLDLQKRFPGAPSIRVNNSSWRVSLEKAGEVSPMRMFEAWNIWTKEYFESKDIVVRDLVATPEEVSFSLSESYPIYKFSKYIRKPTLQCIKCMASFWGTLFYWPAAISLFGFQPIEIIVWIIFCLALSWVNTFLHNKL